ncbi:MAG: ABC transporter ATP-binding protein [Clostridium sp.]|nr:ABC transporter ATP-binding protein [Clostridium sp.]MDD7139316.1 ABC transporter ATP-binding protein [Clostridium sp.]
MALLEVEGLTKRYPGFTLDGVSFRLETGYIMGFIGRNGAGKTTTLKSMLGLVHADAGSVRIDGTEYREDEHLAKQKLGVAFGGVDYYPRARLSDIARVTRRFYEAWDETQYRALLQRFQLDEKKRARELSQGMKVKFSLALALSHNAKLLLLDEPTSGLDPVSREELIELLQHIVEDGEHSILFSTHITSDLEKCADYITYIRGGRIAASTDLDSFKSEYRLVRGTRAQLTEPLVQKFIGARKNAFGFTALAKAEDAAAMEGLEIAPADLESIMIYFDGEVPADERIAL